MAGMYELPPLADAVLAGREPLLRARHAITNTNYYVQVFTPRSPRDRGLRRSVTAPKESLEWVLTSTLRYVPLTGMARKALQRLKVMEVNDVLVEGAQDEAQVEAAGDNTIRLAEMQEDESFEEEFG